MKFHKQRFEGVWVIEAEPISDNRGSFRRHFCQKEFQKIGLETQIVQTNFSENKSKHTLRGFHYQLAPYEEAKVLTCVEGEFYDVIIDLRPDSETFLQWMSVQLKAGDNLSLYIPYGCANGYLTLKDSTKILYYMSEFYSPGSYTGFRYNDPLFSVKWPAEPAFISEKDSKFDDVDPRSFKNK